MADLRRGRMKQPQTKYARSGNTHIAYRVTGSGPVDVVLVSDWVTDIETWTEVGPLARFLERIASFARVISFDHPGLGQSDRFRPEQLPTLEEYSDAIGAVMDDVGLQRAALVAWGVGAFGAVMFAASYPERTSALVLLSPTARMTADVDYPGFPEGSQLAASVEVVASLWGTLDWATWLIPSLADDLEARIAWARWNKIAVSPAMVKPIIRMMVDLDVRDLLPVVPARALVLHASHSAIQPLHAGRYIAAHIPRARIAVRQSGDHFPNAPDELDWYVGEIQEFLTGERPPMRVDEDRVLATVLYTDFVDSTKQSVDRGDRAWRELLDRHDDIARRHIQDHRGSWVKHTGDGVIATFDGPARAVRCACAIRDSVHSLGIDIRSGLHTGEIEIRGDDYSGIAMSIGSRVMSLAGAGEVLVSSTVVDLVAGSGLEFEDRGEHELKGVPRPWRIYAVTA